jgi:hypothetical protein
MTRDLFDDYCARGANILVSSIGSLCEEEVTDNPSVRGIASPDQSRVPVRR